MKRLLLPLLAVLALPNAVNSEDITLDCTYKKFKQTRDVIEQKLVGNQIKPVVVDIKFDDWKKHDFKKHGSANQKFKFNEEKGFVDVYFANPKGDRGTKDVTFQPDLIAFTLPRKESYDDTYIIDNYQINRKNGNFSRELKHFSSKKPLLISVMKWEGNCKKYKSRTLF